MRAAAVIFAGLWLVASQANAQSTTTYNTTVVASSSLTVGGL